jgi:hypothetical protein
MSREIANRSGHPRSWPPDGSLREPEPELLEQGEPVWGRPAEG